MLSILITWLLAAQAVRHGPVDAAALKIGTPAVLAKIDTDMMKGEPRRLAWSADGSQIYLQMVEGAPPDERARHYTYDTTTGLRTGVDLEPEWASDYWAVKQDRVAPGLEALVIAVEQKTETIKSGTGGAGVLDRTSSPDSVAASGPSVESLGNGLQGNQRARVVRLSLLGEQLGEWINQRAIPGVQFGWGPFASGLVAHVGEDGRLVIFDQKKHRQTVPNVKRALLPAWSPAGDRLAYVEKTGRRTYTIAWVPLTW